MYVDVTDRKKAEEEMARLSSFPTLNPNPIVEIDFEGNVEYANPSAKTKFSNIEALGSKHPFLANYKSIIQIFNDKTANNIINEIKIGDNWYLQQYSKVPKSQCIRIYAIDITERKKAEDALILAKNRLVEEHTDLSRLQEISTRFVSQGNMQALLDDIVSAAIELTNSDMGNLQLVDEEGTLRIVAQRGFNKPFLDFFCAVNNESHSVCGAVLSCRKRVLVEDVTKSPIFVNTPALAVQLNAGVRAVQSTPLFTRSGEFLGVLSTHFREHHLPNESQLRLLDLLVREAADFIERTRNEQKLEEYSQNLEKLVEERTKQLKDSERLAAIGATAGMVGHDIRNPLQAITSDIYLAKTDLASTPDSEEKKNALESLARNRKERCLH